MKEWEARIMEPIGAPRPLEKHIVTLSKQSQYSFNVPAPAATASHNLAPSRCRFMGGFCDRAQLLMSRQSARGSIVPPRVFSRQMRRVGQKWWSVLVTACFFISARVR